MQGQATHHQKNHNKASQTITGAQAQQGYVQESQM